MHKVINIKDSPEKMVEYHSLQYQNFQLISKLFTDYLLAIPTICWDEIVKELENVLSKCDEIDYQSDACAIAYAIWHFLDRYHRMQIMCSIMLEKGYLNQAKQYDILDVGTGPSQVLFALSDHFENLNNIEQEILCTINPDYVEQSKGFRNFLHTFTEYALQAQKQYMVPFHFGRTQNIFDITFDEQCSITNTYNKYRYDITVFNNFLTTQTFTEQLSDKLKEICKYTRNNGLIIIIGASEQSDKYKKIYPFINQIINKPFKNRAFHGYWTKIYDQTFTYKYDDEYAVILGNFFENIIKFLEDNNIWTSVPDAAKQEFKKNSSISGTNDSTKKQAKSTWKMVVYRKKSKPSFRLPNKPLYKNKTRLSDHVWKQNITNKDI